MTRLLVATASLIGFSELANTLEQLPKATARNTLVRVLKKAADTVEQAARANAPKESGELDRDIHVGTRLTRRQTRDNRLTKSFAELHIGTALSRGMFTNFGTFKDHPQLWFDRAWAGTQGEALAIIAREMSVEITKSAARYAKKLAKGA